MCIECVKKAALKAMSIEADGLGVRGVAIALITDTEVGNRWDPLMEVVGGFFREAEESRGAGDPGSSYAAVAWSKVAEMLETENDSGTVEGRQPRKGEFGYKGGITLERAGHRIYVAFSGGTEEEDLAIAEAGGDAAIAELDSLVQVTRVLAMEVVVLTWAEEYLAPKPKRRWWFQRRQ